MKYMQGNYPILKKTAIAKDIFSFTLSCPDVAAQAQPGQFVHILPAGAGLRRPISIAGIDREHGTLRLVFAIRGKGTETLSRLNPGDAMDMIAPLGHGFTLLPEAAHVILVGGGIGVPPMLPLADYYGVKAAAISGFRSFSQVILQEDLEAAGAQTICCTEDGSAGAVRGFVTAPLEQLVSEGADMVYACGPVAMLKAVAQVCLRQQVRCEVSLEERMACGVGACLCCATRTQDADGGEHYLHVCKDGPVFRAEEVIW